MRSARVVKLDLNQPKKMRKSYSLTRTDIMKENLRERVAQRVTMAATDPVNFVGYCGLYCNACRIRQGEVEEAVANLRDTIDSLGIEKNVPELAHWEPRFKHYEGFKQVMDGLVKIFGYCAGCLENGGDPNCKVRICARQKGYRTCSECAEVETCQKLDPYRRFFEPALRSIKEKGVKGYAEEMQTKVDQGYSYPVEVNSPP